MAHPLNYELNEAHTEDPGFIEGGIRDLVNKHHARRRAKKQIAASGDARQPTLKRENELRAGYGLPALAAL
jgi:hypothetical protein